MKAVRYARFGSPEVLSIVDASTPKPEPGEALIRIEAASLNPADVKFRRGYLGWLTRWSLPRGTGLDFSGIVTSVGADVQGIAAGDHVFGALDPLGAQGSCGEFATASLSRLTRKPDDLPHAVSATLGTAGCAALDAVDGVGQGQRCLIVGAAGAVGFMAAQLAMLQGAQVIAVCGARHAERMRAIGVVDVVDYRTKPLREWSERFDVVIEASGVYAFADLRHLIAPEGLFVALAPTGAMALRRALRPVLGGPRMRLLATRATSAKLAFLGAEAAAGRLIPPPAEILGLAEVAEGHRRIEAGLAGAKLVVCP